MKKYIKYILLLLILLPFNVMADSTSIWRLPYNSTSYSSNDSLYGYYGTSSGNLSPLTNYTTRFYYKTNDTSFAKNIYDYVEIPFFIRINGYTNQAMSTLYTIPNADTLYYVYNNVQLQFSIIYSNNQYDSYSTCTVSSNNYTGSDAITGILKCSVDRAADGIRNVAVQHNLQVSGSNYTIFFGTNGWINFIYKNDNGSISSSINNQTTNITNAQNQTTNAVNNNTNAINNMNSSITDSSTNNDSDNQTIINNFNSKVASNNTISSLITMPITIFQKILNSVNGSCTPFTLGNLLGTNISMPCINLQNYIGNELYNIIDIIISGLFIFSISKTMIKVFNNFTSLKDKGDILGGVD